MSILNKYKRWIPLLIPIKDEYFDFVLSQDDTPSIPYDGKLTKRCLSSYVDFSDRNYVNNGYAMSNPDFIWEDSVCSGATLFNIGFTGIDNGLIYYGGYDKITNEEFYNIFTNTEYEIFDGDYTLKLKAVTGNTGVYSYDFEEINDKESYYALKGGFFQGFYKLFGKDYQVLPQYIRDGWNLEFVIRPKFYPQKENTLNMTHEGNEGIFFYMGTRAENKFSQVYNSDFSKYKTRVQPKHDLCENIIHGGLYISDAENDENAKIIKYNEELKTNKSFNKEQAFWIEYYMNINKFPDYNNCGCKYCNNNITGDTESDEPVNIPCNEYTYDPSYFAEDINISGLTLTTSDGIPLEASGYYEIETDNKFLTFNRTKYGFTVATWDEDTVVILTGITQSNGDNLFLLMNRTKSGYTVSTIDDYYKDNQKEYNFTNATFGNSFALKYNSDGSISYRYMVKDCDSEDGYSVLEESTFPCMVKENEWNDINVSFSILGNDNLNDCGKPMSKRKMKIRIYVNGYLKFVSKELPEFDFRELNDVAEKQEGVPFNISLGGGTQGLCDSVWLNYWQAFEKILPLEENFAGTFIGDIRSFKFYTCPLEFAEINNNAIYEIKQ